jgi:hypothetical protein
MSSGKDNQVDWSGAATPNGERVGPGHSGSMKRIPLEAHTRHSVMNTLLGENKLAAYDASGNDPYNTTGKFFQR